MNDRFKFRIWDKIHNRFLCIDNQKRIIFDYEDKEIRILEDEENACWLHIPFDECIILQCTGLKDKNGKLIYEGDIVIEHYYNTKETAIKKVFFDEKVIGFAYTDGIEYNQLSITDGDRLQVIGNIYENAELIEE